MAAIAAETVIEATAMAAAVAEVHTTINQKAAALAAETVVKVVVTVVAMAEAKAVAEGAVATLHQQLWQ